MLLITFSKRTDMLDYLRGNYEGCIEMNGLDIKDTSTMNVVREKYAKERDVRLILKVRFDRATHKIFCTIQCPINPLPVKGEFETPSVRVLEHFLKANGWEKREVINLDLI